MPAADAASASGTAAQHSAEQPRRWQARGCRDVSMRARHDVLSTSLVVAVAMHGGTMMP